MQGWTTTTKLESQEKKHKKDYKIQKICLEQNHG